MQTDGGKYTNTYNSNQNLYAYTHQNQRQYANQNRENGQQKFHIQLEHNQQQFPVQNNLLNANGKCLMSFKCKLYFVQTMFFKQLQYRQIKVMSVQVKSKIKR